MKILLVRPPVPYHTIGLKHIMICEPLELEYAAAGLHGHDLQIMDMILEKGFKKRLLQFKPDVVCSSCYITGVNEVIKLFREVKAWNKDCLTIAGGVQAAQVPEDFADPSVDIIVKGDGTTTLPTVIATFEKGTSFFDIPGLAFPIAENEVISTAGHPYMPKADSLPFPRRDLIAHLKHRYYYLMHSPLAMIKTTWGCWYKCNFCYTWRITDGSVYSRSPESIVEELKSIEEKEIYIVDDIFLIKPTRLRKLADLIKAEGIKKNYIVYARADFIAKNEEIIAEWASLGLSAVFIGLEASTNEELDAMDKECTVDYNREAIEVLKRHKIDTYGSLIPQPSYTKKDWDRLWDFIRSTGLYYVNISPMTPFPGTLASKENTEEYIIPRKAHSLWDLSHTVLKTKEPIKAFYRQLLKIYVKTVLDISRADKHAQRTLPSMWSVRYFKLISGALKIGWQFFNAHKHHNAKNLKIAMYRGTVVPGLDFKSKFNSTLFKLSETEKKKHEDLLPSEPLEQDSI